MFFFQNWGGDNSGGDYTGLASGLEFAEGEEENEEEEEETKNGWFPRLQIKSRLDAVTAYCFAKGSVLELIVEGIMVMLMLVALLPIGQLLPILLWLQAKQESGKAPLLPVKPEAPAKFEIPEDVAALSKSVLGREPRFFSEIVRLYQVASSEQKESVKLFAADFQAWEIEHRQWYFREYLPYLDQKDRYFQWELKVKISTQLPFVIETCVEAIPQSLLQTTAIVIENQRDPGAISPMQFLSIGMSMMSIASKAYILCTSLVRIIFNFKMLCLAADLAAVFYTVAAFWSTRRSDQDAVDVFFLTRPVDLCTAGYVYALFSWAVLFSIWCFLRTLALIIEWLLYESAFRLQSDDGQEVDSQAKHLLGIVHSIFTTWAKNWPTDLIVFPNMSSGKAEFDADKTPVLSVASFMLAAWVFVLIATTFSLIVIIIPLIILIMLPHISWVCVWIKRAESEMSGIHMQPPKLMAKHEILEAIEEDKEGTRYEGQIVFDWGDEDDSEDGMGMVLYISGDVDSLGSDRTRVDGNLNDFLDKLSTDSPLLWVTARHAELMKSQMNWDGDLDELILAKTGFYTQAFAWTVEEPDFLARLSAVKHGILAQENLENYDEKAIETMVQKTKTVVLPSCLFLRFGCQVVKNIGESFELLELPVRVLNVVAGQHKLCSTFGRLCENQTINMFKAARSDEEADNDVERRAAAMISSWRGLRPYLCIYIYFVNPLGWFVQKLVITMTCVVAAFGFFFPVMSFTLACYHAIQQNKCGDNGIFNGDVKLTQSRLVSALSGLFDDECYDNDGKPLNWFRLLLFLIQASLLGAACIYGIFVARKFIIFAMVIPRYDIAGSDKVDSLMQIISSLHRQYYAEDKEDRVTDEQRVELGVDEIKEAEKDTDAEENEESEGEE